MSNVFDYLEIRTRPNYDGSAWLAKIYLCEQLYIPDGYKAGPVFRAKTPEETVGLAVKFLEDRPIQTDDI